MLNWPTPRYCLEERQWSVHSCMLGKRKRHQAVVLAGRVYVLGGSNEYSVVQAGVEVMDLQTGVWSEGVPMLNRCSMKVRLYGLGSLVAGL